MYRIQTARLSVKLLKLTGFYYKEVDFEMRYLKGNLQGISIGKLFMKQEQIKQYNLLFLSGKRNLIYYTFRSLNFPRNAKFPK